MKSELESFFSSLHAGQTGVLELRAFDSKGLQEREFLPVKGGVLDLSRVEDFVCTTEQKGLDAYFGVALRTRSALKDKKGDAAHCQTLTALFVDADFKLKGEEETRRRLAECPLSPSVVVHSGGGLHAYWVLKDPMLLKVAGGMKQTHDLLQRWAQQFEGVVDLVVSEPVRVLRIPGSTNYKPAYDRPPVEIEHVASTTYTVDELEQLVGDVPPTPESGPFLVPETVGQGERHDTMFKLLRSQKARGISLAAALTCCHEENRQKNSPPVDEAELDGYLRRSWHQGDSAAFEEQQKTPTFISNKTNSGISATNQQNVRLAIEKLGVRVTFDEFAQKMLVASNGGPPQPLDDRVAVPTWLRIEQEHEFRPTRELFDAVIKATGWSNTFHPVLDYLNGLSWDGTPRLDTWLNTYGGAETSDYVGAVGRLVLMAAVRRVRRPGCKFDELLVLESRQGTLKSSALRTLCPKDAWFSDDLPLGVDAKQVIERTAGKWLIVASDLHGKRRREAEQVKAFLSRQVDGPVRKAYARLSEEVRRQFVVVGTTNERAGYLNDATGARRFWPVTVERFDLRMLRRDRDQLWAEAAVREAEKGASIRLDPSLYHVAEQEQEARFEVDEWEDLLREKLGIDLDNPDTNPASIPVADVWHQLGIPHASMRDNRQAHRLNAIMPRFGYPKKKVIRVGKKTVRCWIRDDTLLL
jgi:hypothetical protein